jgi:hypothetical protein
VSAACLCFYLASFDFGFRWEWDDVDDEVGRKMRLNKMRDELRGAEVGD